MEVKLGKIASVGFGFGGYQDCQFGLSVSLTGEGWGVSDFKGGWGMEPSDHNEWDANDQRRFFADTMVELRDLLKAAKKDTVDQLKGVPVQVTFDGMKLKGWNILTEVL